MYYAGIGARQTPTPVLNQMTILANNLEASGFILRSGGAAGADTAFEEGVREEDHKEIYLPWQGFNNSKSSRYGIDQQALHMAKYYHPAWERCSSTARKFHARNCYQIVGKDLQTPVGFVLCWTADGKASGGTGQAMRIAEDKSIPIINMQWDDWEQAFDEHMSVICN